MNRIRCTLVSDGSSDIALLPLLEATLRHHLPAIAVETEWADLRRLPRPPKRLSEKIRVAIDLFPCNLLFVHRDAEAEPASMRVAEIAGAVSAIGRAVPETVCVVPVRMQEAWLLVDERALRRASGNPNSKQTLKLPPIRRLEGVPDPKALLHNLLIQASECSPHRRSKFPVHERALRVASFIDSLTPLRELPSFRQFEDDAKRALAALGLY